jgi:hypothetical protein
MLSERVMLGASLDAASSGKRDRAAAYYYKMPGDKPQSAESAGRSLARFGSNRMMDGLAKGRQQMLQQTRGLANSRAAMPAPGFGGGGGFGAPAPSAAGPTPLALKAAVEEKSKAVSEYLRADGDVNFTSSALQATAA